MCSISIFIFGSVLWWLVFLLTPYLDHSILYSLSLIKSGLSKVDVFLATVGIYPKRLSALKSSNSFATMMQGAHVVKIMQLYNLN